MSVPVLSALESVTGLYLVILDGDNKVLDVVSQFGRLHHLSIAFPEPVTLTAERLLALRTLAQLRSLILLVEDNDYGLHTPTFSNRHCAELAARLPHLCDWDV